MEDAAGGRDRVILNLNQPGPWSLALVQDLHTCLRAIEEEGVEEVWIRISLTFLLGFVLTVPYTWAHPSRTKELSNPCTSTWLVQEEQACMSAEKPAFPMPFREAKT